MERQDRDAGIYVRISRDREGDGLGVQRQEDLCRKLAEEQGWRVVDVYNDNDRPAGKKRPEYDRMLRDVRDGRLEAILAYGTDRLLRSSQQQLNLLRLSAETGVIVRTLTGGKLDHATAGGKLQAKIAADIAEYEIEIRSERVKAKMAELRREGKTQGGRRCFGLTEGRTGLQTDEAERVRIAADDVLSGTPLRAIARQWNEAGITTVAGKQWSSTVLKGLLTAAWTRGVTPDGNEAKWPALIDEVTGHRLDAILLDPSRQTRRPETRRHLLTSLLRCGKCQGKMGSHRANGQRGYGCAFCMLRVKAADAEEDITNRVLSRLDARKVATGLVERLEPTDDESRLQALAARKDELLDMFWQGELDRYGFNRLMAEVDTKRSIIRSSLVRSQELEQQRRLQVEAFDLAASWDHLDLDYRRQILDAFVRQIDVAPGVRGRNSYDARRLTVSWRDF